MPHLDSLYAMALRLTRDSADAEDLVQDALVKAYRFHHRYQEGTNIRAWLFKLMVNLFYNDRRKNKNDQRLRQQVATQRAPLFEAQAAAQGQEEAILERLSEDRIKSALEALPEDFRVAVVLCDLYDFSYKEIAEILDCPVGTVMSRLYRGRRRLQEQLFEYAVEQGVIRAPAGDGASADLQDLEAYRRQRSGRQKVQ